MAGAAPAGHAAGDRAGGGRAAGGAAGAVEGAEHGAGEGRREGSQIGGAALGAVGGAVGTGVGAATEALAGLAVADLLAAFPEVLGVMAAVIAAAETDIVAKAGTAISHVEASHDHLSGPTHSEIAKDAPDNPLFPVSARLAEVADQAIGCAMIAAWNANAAAGAQQSAITEHVTTLVDRYVQHPALDGWWRPYLLGAAHGALPPIPSGCAAHDDQHDDQHPTTPQLQDGTREWHGVVEPFATGKAQLPESGQGVLQGLRRQATAWREQALTQDGAALRAAGIDPEQNLGLHIEIQGWASKSWHSAHNEAARQRRNEVRARSVADTAGALFAGIATVDQVEGMGSGVMVPGGDAIETEGQATMSQGDLEARRASLRARLAQARAGGTPEEEVALLQAELEQATRQLAYFHTANDPHANVEETRRAEVRITWHGKTLAGDAAQAPAGAGKP